MDLSSSLSTIGNRKHNIVAFDRYSSHLYFTVILYHDDSTTYRILLATYYRDHYLEC